MFTLAFDIGGTNTRAAVIAADGSIVSVAKHNPIDREPRSVVECVARSMDEALQKAPGAAITACGAGVAAQLNPVAGTVRVAPNLGWRDVPLAALLYQRIGRRVELFNDLSAAAYGEFRAGAGRGHPTLLTIFVGTGVGSAIIAEGQLVQGAGGVAGELGHIKVVPEGRLCGCGEKGCLEAYAGGQNLIEQSRVLLESHRAPRLAELCRRDASKLNAVMLEQAAEQGDEAARDIYLAAREHLAVAIANAVTWINPSRLVLGGGVISHCPGIRAGIVEGIAKYASRVSQQGFSIADAELGDDSGLVGAGLLARPSLA